MIYTDSAVLILRLHFPTRLVYTTLTTYMHSTLNSPICNLLETKCKTYFIKDYTTPTVLTHPFTYFQVILDFFFLIFGSRTFFTKTATNFSAQLKKTNPPVLN